MKNLLELLKDININDYKADLDLQITGLQYDSRKIEKGNLFVANKGEKFDGHQFLESAFSKGAIAAIVDENYSVPENLKNLTILKVPNTRKALAILSKNWFDNPGKDLNIVGVTGTNGKTTITYLLKSIFSKAGFKTGLIGTTGILINDELIPATHTTPESLELNALLSRMRDEKVDYVFMEVSSHSLDQHRVDGISFKAGIFTNLTLDHLDYHLTMDEYAKAKKKLFDMLDENSIAIAFNNSEYLDFILSDCKSKKIIVVGRNDNDNIKILNEKIDISHSEYELIEIKNLNLLKEKTRKIKTSLLGKFNIENTALSFITAICLGIDEELASASLLTAGGAPGRMQTINLRNGATAIVDYAHTPDALEKALKACREILHSNNQGSEGRLLSVFGCGGDRDKTKRPIMGKISSELADYTFITSDNPRTEDPDRIVKQIYSGISPEGKKSVRMISVRQEAIEAAVNFSKEGDIILVAGKGHEKYQIIGTEKIHFDDVEVLEKFA
ncbi:MAG: UDP-N-acetylmuramoyl-L-alanyl-D-glutamate--2,6-diaminopimelate ligase [Candidatus Kapabacteria bacterium]|nr:UDP-N-acetylmuramoyl-L-alanyl-D-glutamate--2,6-diaminopimelate ligase [Candidatus Kapabacteria bacterium]